MANAERAGGYPCSGYIGQPGITKGLRFLQGADNFTLLTLHLELECMYLVVILSHNQLNLARAQIVNDGPHGAA